MKTLFSHKNIDLIIHPRFSYKLNCVISPCFLKESVVLASLDQDSNLPHRLHWQNIPTIKL